MRFECRTFRSCDVTGGLTFSARLGVVIASFGLTVALSTFASAATPTSTASGTAAARGETTPAGKNLDAKSAESKSPRPLAGFTPEREAVALEFVRTNHPELAVLLERLKARRPHDYEKAIRDLFRASERLAMSESTAPLRYELELKQWKLTSRIQVVGARLAMQRTQEQEQELKQLLAEQLEVHRELVAFNLDRAKARSANLQRELDDINARKQAILDAKFDKAIKAAEQRKPGGKPIAKPTN